MNGSLFPVPSTIFSRTWALPSPWTFSIPPIADFVRRWTTGRAVIVDPFRGNSAIAATYRNDLVPARAGGGGSDAG